MPPCFSPDRYVAASRFAAMAHRGQTEPGNDLPYFFHVGLVAMEVIAALEAEPAGDPDLAVQCALLHDTIEDTAVTYDDVAAAFGAAVADGVRALSKDPRLPKAEAMADSLRRIRDQPREVWLVKLADRITNLEAPPAYWSREKRTRYRDEATEILAALGEASPYLAARLQIRIEAYEAHIAAASA